MAKIKQHSNCDCTDGEVVIIPAGPSFANSSHKPVYRLVCCKCREPGVLDD